MPLLMVPSLPLLIDTATVPRSARWAVSCVVVVGLRFLNMAKNRISGTLDGTFSLLNYIYLNYNHMSGTLATKDMPNMIYIGQCLPHLPTDRATWLIALWLITIG